MRAAPENSLASGLLPNTPADGRIFMMMVEHAAFDLTALAMIYWDVETAVAHLVFKYAAR